MSPHAAPSPFAGVMAVVGRLLEAVATGFGKEAVRRAARRSAYGFSGEACRHRADRFIAGTRLAVILCALLVIAIDPSGSAHQAPSVMSIAIAYTLYSLTLIWWAWTSVAGLGERARLGAQLIDMVVAVVHCLAAAAVRLEIVRRQLEVDPAAARDTLHNLQGTIMLQQRELRSFIREPQTGRCGSDPGLIDLLAGLVLRIEREWQLAVKLPGR